MKQALRRSRRAFSERFGVPGERNYYAWLQEQAGLASSIRPEALRWSPRGQASNCPTINEILDRYRKYSPWQLHASLDEIFVGRVNALSPNAAAQGSFGSTPCIAISDGLYIALDQCLYLWENVGRLQANVFRLAGNGNLTEDEIRLYIEKWATKRELPEFTLRMIDLKLFLVDKDPSFMTRYQSRSHLFQLHREGVSDIDFDHRKRRMYVAEGFIIGHELAHILLGHLGSPAKKATQDYLSCSPVMNIDKICITGESSPIQLQEVQADLTGYLELLFASTWEQIRRTGFHPYGPDRSRLGLVVQCADGIAIAILAMYLVSALGAAPTSFSTHPHPDDRLTAITNMMNKQIDEIISNTTESDLGPEGHGFFERISSAPRQVYTTYSTCKNTLESALRQVL